MAQNTDSKLQEVLSKLDNVLEKNRNFEREMIHLQDEVVRLRKSNYEMKNQLDDDRIEIKKLQLCLEILDNKALSANQKRGKDVKSPTRNEYSTLMAKVDRNEERLERNFKVFNRIHVSLQDGIDVRKEVRDMKKEMGIISDKIIKVKDSLWDYEEEKRQKIKRREDQKQHQKARKQQQKQNREDWYHQQHQKQGYQQQQKQGYQQQQKQGYQQQQKQQQQKRQHKHRGRTTIFPSELINPFGGQESDIEQNFGLDFYDGREAEIERIFELDPYGLVLD